MKRKLGAVVVAAGKGSRMGTEESKQYLRLGNKPIIIHTLETFERMAEIDEIALVVGADDVERCRQWISEYGIRKATSVVAGGNERQHSVYKGLAQLDVEYVLIHDGVRPFVRMDHARACFDEAVRSGAAVLAVPVKDTIKQVNESGVIQTTPDRRSLWAIQTPQAFRHSVVLAAHEQARKDGFIGTDDSMLVERLGIPVTVVEGDYTNIKITTPEDLDFAALLLKKRGEER
ncbi:2-C-methyl-D-erythritol 4-phosphate cytidylyltransferase [Paenibacillus sp. MSJ-34]|uniref:2-C-methyl-D-erythritol 4-phosphate cytidylyltransferase n=1 Tax=Paenibacillus sp. MSJ-34 TaxID=2841529 RepID=UPI001C112DF7|nr:2-C-methyl-D-erythritol 4-phosphate cytidylyltransferase [Paenibacillus sp. MSJ-34]MBU5443731.1 2-C-methyl-D-erythritol 4-phosphate cytidylyltransferase [Paenibacillus sp. MSJ-34]